MSGVRKALALSLSQRFLSYGVQLGTTIIISRLITPAQAGVFSLAVGMVAIAQMFRDFGVGEYLVQEKFLDHDTVRAAFAIALTLGWGLGAILYFLAEPAARFYREPVIAEVIRILCINFFLVPLGYVANAMLTREMRFDLLLVIQTSSAVFGAAVSITLAWMGYGSVGLAWSLVAGVLANVIVMSFIRPREMLFRPNWSGWSRIGHFGIYKTGSFLLEQLTRRAPDFFIARSLGFTQSGLYSRAGGLSATFADLLMSSVYRVALPSFAKLRNEGSSLGKAYLDANRILSCLPLSLFSFTAVYSDPIIHFLFGSQWTGAIVAMRWGGVCGMILTPIMLATPLLTANGAVKNQFRIQLIGNPIQIALIALGALHSIEAVAAMGVLTSLMWVYLMHQLVKSSTGVRVRDLLIAVLPGLWVALAALPIPTMFLLLAKHYALSDPLICILGAIIYVICWLGSLYLLKHPYRSECGKILKQIGLLKGA